MRAARVIGIGQAARGDDGVGPAVIAQLRRDGVPPGTTLCCLSHPLELLEVLRSPDPVVLVDAVLGDPVGQVLDLSADDLEHRRPDNASTHGVGVPQAIALARAMLPALPEIRIVAVTICPPRALRFGLSEACAAAVPAAAAKVRMLLGC